MSFFWLYCNWNCLLAYLFGLFTANVQKWNWFLCINLVYARVKLIVTITNWSPTRLTKRLTQTPTLTPSDGKSKEETHITYKGTNWMAGYLCIRIHVTQNFQIHANAFKNEGETKTSKQTKRRRKCTAGRSALQNMLKEVLWEEGKWYPEKIRSYTKNWIVLSMVKLRVNMNFFSYASSP